MRSSLLYQPISFVFKMHKMWNFSTLQRPTQEEKERRRKYREEKIRHANTLLPKTKVGRAKTFRMERNNNEIESYEAATASGGHHGGVTGDSGGTRGGPTSLPISASMVEVLRHRAKSATRMGEMYHDAMASSSKKRPKDRDHSAHGGFVSRLRFLDEAGGGGGAGGASAGNTNGTKLRWQDREPSSGYSSGGRGGHDPDLTTSDDNIYGVKFSSMPHTSHQTSSKG